MSSLHIQLKSLSHAFKMSLKSAQEEKSDYSAAYSIQIYRNQGVYCACKPVPQLPETQQKQAFISNMVSKIHVRIYNQPKQHVTNIYHKPRCCSHQIPTTDENLDADLALWQTEEPNIQIYTSRGVFISSCYSSIIHEKVLLWFYQLGTTQRVLFKKALATIYEGTKQSAQLSLKLKDNYHTTLYSVLLENSNKVCILALNVLSLPCSQCTLLHTNSISAKQSIWKLQTKTGKVVWSPEDIIDISFYLTTTPVCLCSADGSSLMFGKNNNVV